MSGSGPPWTLQFYEEEGREPVLDFLRDLDEVREQALAAALRNVLAIGMVREVLKNMGNTA